MAKVKFGELAADVRGSIDGVTYSKNRFGAYVRSRTAPIQSRTAFQLARRQAFTDLSALYRGLTASQKVAWGAFGLTITKTDSLGQAYTLTGAQAYVMLNLSKFTIGASRLDTPPILDDPGIIGATTVVVDASAQTAIVTVTGALTQANFVNVWATAPVSAGRNFFKGLGTDGLPKGGDFRYLMTANTTPLDPDEWVAGLSLTTEYLARFGALTSKAGAKVAFLFVPISANSIQGEPIRVDVIVVP